MKKLPHFQQSGTRAWVWIFIIVVHICLAAYAFVLGSTSAAFINLFIAGGAYWIDKLEKEVTRRNVLDRANDDGSATKRRRKVDYT